MKKTILFIALLATLISLNSCGYTERTQARSAATIAEAQARQKEAEANAQIADASASITNMKTLADAAKPDNTVLILMLLGMFGIGGMLVYMLVRTNYTHAQTMQAVIMAQLPTRTYTALPEPPSYVAIAARHWGGRAVHNGEHWEIVSSNGRLLASERRQPLQGKLGW